jgi:hypothetical protein
MFGRLCGTVVFLCLMSLGTTAAERLRVTHAGQLLAIAGQKCNDFAGSMHLRATNSLD